MKTGRVRTDRADRAGLTLIEILISLTILTIALGAFGQAIVGSTEHTVSQRETTIVTEAARRTLETLQATEFDEVFRRFNDDPNDDPASGLSPGPDVDVPGLEALPTDPDGFIGQVVFPTTTLGGGAELREDVQDPALGMPRDLNGDGVVDALDHSADYRLLPVLVRFEWTTPSGPAEVEFRSILAEY